MNLKPITAIGAIGTAAWVGFVAWYIDRYEKWQSFSSMELSQFGDFFAGVSAPLAFWWLVLGYFQQGIELRQNVNVLKQQSIETANLVAQQKLQTDAIKANLALASDQSLIAKRNLFIVTAEPILAELHEIGIVLYEKCEAASSEWTIRRRAWKDRFDAGDKQIIFRGMADYFNSGLSDALFVQNLNQPEVKSAIVRYMECFEILLRNASASEFGDFDMADFYRYSNFGKLYRALEKHHSAGAV
jgi:hypothetical protein